MIAKEVTRLKEARNVLLLGRMSAPHTRRSVSHPAGSGSQPRPWEASMSLGAVRGLGERFSFLNKTRKLWSE